MIKIFGSAVYYLSFFLLFLYEKQNKIYIKLFNTKCQPNWFLSGGRFDESTPATFFFILISLFPKPKSQFSAVNTNRPLISGMAATSQAHLLCFSAVHRSQHLRSRSLPFLSFRPSKVISIHSSLLILTRVLLYPIIFINYVNAFE